VKHEIIFTDAYFFCHFYVYFTAHLRQNDQSYYIYSASPLCTVATLLGRCELSAIRFLDAFRNLIQNLLENSMTLEFKFRVLSCKLRCKLTSSLIALMNVFCTELATISKIKYPYTAPRPVLNSQPQA